MSASKTYTADVSAIYINTHSGHAMYQSNSVRYSNIAVICQSNLVRNLYKNADVSAFYTHIAASLILSAIQT